MAQDQGNEQPEREQAKKKKKHLEPIFWLIIIFIIIPIVLPLLMICLLKVISAVAELTGLEEKPRIVKAAPDSRKQIQESLEKWRQKNLPQLPTFRFVDLAIKENYVWAVGFRTGYHGYSRLLHSSDSGKNWEVQYRDDKADLFEVHFFSKTDGLIASGTNILETSDGGKTWNILLTVRNMPGLAIQIIKKVTVKDQNHLTVRLRGDLRGTIETTDGGKTWRYIIHHGKHYGSRTVNLETKNKGLIWRRIKETPEKRADCFLSFSFQKNHSIIQKYDKLY